MATMDVGDWGIGAPAESKFESEATTSPMMSPPAEPDAGPDSSPPAELAPGADSSPPAESARGTHSAVPANSSAGPESLPSAEPSPGSDSSAPADSAAGVDSSPPSGAESSLKRNATQAGIGETATVAPQVRTVTSATAALSRNENTRDGKMGYREEQLALLGMAAPPRNFTNADKAAWTKEERSSYNFQCQMHGPAYASAFMRNYFKENEGKPLPPNAPPRSAFAIFRLERFAEIGCSAGGFKGTGKKKKNYSKQVGNEWTELSEEQQQPYEATFAAKMAEHEKATEAYEAALEQWEQQKQQAAR